MYDSMWRMFLGMSIFLALIIVFHFTTEILMYTGAFVVAGKHDVKGIVAAVSGLLGGIGSCGTLVVAFMAYKSWKAQHLFGLSYEYLRNLEVQALKTLDVAYNFRVETLKFRALHKEQLLNEDTGNDFGNPFCVMVEDMEKNISDYHICLRQFTSLNSHFNSVAMGSLDLPKFKKSVCEIAGFTQEIDDTSINHTLMGETRNNVINHVQRLRKHIPRLF